MNAPTEQTPVERSTASVGDRMLSRIVRHMRGNLVGYVALFAALGGTSYAAVRLAPGSVTTRALANGAVTSSKLARNSVAAGNIRRHSLSASNFTSGALRALSSGPAGPTGAQGPRGIDGSASVVMRAQQSGGSVTAAHGASTNVPLTGASWTQAASDLNLVTGSMQLGIPASCTGSFGNDLIVYVDGIANTFAVAPSAPASATVTIPFSISELMEPGSPTTHTVTTKLVNTCSGSSENYTVGNVKIDAINFH